MNRSTDFLTRFLFLINLSIFLLSLKLYSEERAEKATQSVAPAVIRHPTSNP